MAFTFDTRLLEGRKEYLAKYAGEPGVDGVLAKFWTLRHRVKAPQNDIDWWIKKPYSDLERFVKDFDARPYVQKRRDAHAENAIRNGAKMLGTAGNYEVWYVPSHEAAQEIGRMYRGVSAKWCISTENPEYFDKNYADSEFIFMVLAEGEPELAGFEKLAVEMSYDMDEKIRVDEIWDIDDERVGDRPSYLDNDGLISLVDRAVDMFVKSGLSRRKYQDEFAGKYVNDRKWIKTVLFKGHPELSYGRDGSYSAEYDLDCLDDIIDGGGQNGLDPETVKHILNYEYRGIFYPPDEPNFDVGKAEKAFDRIMRPYGVKWEMLAKIYEGQIPDGMKESLREWIFEALDENFNEGLGYYQNWSDSWVDGTGNEARNDILNQLKDKASVYSCEWSEKAQKNVLKCRFGKNEISDLVKLKLKGNSEDPLVLQLYDRYGDLEKIEIDEPYYGWSSFDENMMAEAARAFAKRLIGRIKMQKDLPGQMRFDFDDDYLDNPDNLPRS